MGTFRKIQRLPLRVAPYLRIRNIRGHGVHSPFVYGIVRNALLFGKGYSGEKDVLYTFLRTVGVNKRAAMQLQNLHNYCEYGKTAIHYGHKADHRGEGKPTLRIFTESCTEENINSQKESFREEEGTVVIISPRSTKERTSLCKQLARQGDCISIDNRGYMLFIYKSGKPPGHYKL